jgi:predicted transposase/invertase (TIGR01784 family)
MQHRIDPKVDCVFKALLGTEENRNLLVHFLNAILEHELNTPIITVDIINPHNDREFVDDKLSIVDVKARDADNQLYQVEIQMLNRSSLPARILYNWTDIYSQQLQSGNDYCLLRPTYSIWLLAEDLLSNTTDYANVYKMLNKEGKTLLDHGGIWLLELNKFIALQIQTEQQRWLQFFKCAEQFDDTNLPDWMNTQEMRQAMTTLRQFSEKERNYHEYQARQNYIREQRAMQRDLEESHREKLAAIEAKEAAMQREQQAIHCEQQAVQEKLAAMQEIERLKAQLAAKNA